MEKRVLLAVILSFLVLYGYQAMFPPPKPPQRPAPQAAPATAPQSILRLSRNRRLHRRSKRQRPLPRPRPLSSQTPASARSSSKTSRCEAVFSTRGGTLKSWRLKKYQDASRAPLELVPTERAGRPAASFHADRRRSEDFGGAGAGIVPAERAGDRRSQRARDARVRVRGRRRHRRRESSSTSIRRIPTWCTSRRR